MNRCGVGCLLAVCLLVSCFASKLYADDPASEMSLAAAARAAKTQFAPLTKDNLQQSKKELLTAANKLNEKLKEDKKNGDGWRKYTQLDKLLAQLGRPEAPDLAALTAIYKKLAAGHEGLELVWFVDVREALRKYIWTAGAIDNPQVKAAYENVLDRLAGELESYAAHPAAETAFHISESLSWLENAGQAPRLVESVRGRLVRPNLYVRIKSDLIGAGIAETVDNVTPVSDCILGTDITGTAHTVGRTSVTLYPDEQVAAFDIILMATADSQSVGRNGPVCIYTTGKTCIGACKRVWMEAEGLFSHPAISNAETSTTINDIVAKRQIIENIAWKRAGEQKGEAEAIASQHAQWRVNERVDKQSAEMLAQANHDYQKKFLRPTTERKVFPQLLQFSTTKDAMHVVSLEAGADQLAAPGEPPALARPDADVSVRVHQSSVNNMAASVLSGMVLHEATLQATISELLGYVPERLKPDPDQEPWTIVFARQQPISVSFGDGGFNITLRGQEYFKGDKGYPGMNVSATYKFVKQGDVFKAIRQGDLQIFPPGFVPGHGQIGVRHQVIRKLLERRVGKILQPELVAKGITPSGKRRRAIGKLYPVEMDAQNGWLVVAWQRESVKR